MPFLQIQTMLIDFHHRKPTVDLFFHGLWTHRYMKKYTQYTLVCVYMHVYNIYILKVGGGGRASTLILS